MTATQAQAQRKDEAKQLPVQDQSDPNVQLSTKEPLVRLVAPVQRLLEATNQIQEFKAKVLKPTDYVLIGTGKDRKPYIKKSGVLKIALAFGISQEKRDERCEDFADGNRECFFTYRAVAPNGRFADAVGSASTKERKFTHPTHDVRSLAQTRACNRAILNLVGGGEVSAEEMVSLEIREQEASEEITGPSEISHAGTKVLPDSPIPMSVSPSQPTEISVGTSQVEEALGTKQPANVPPVKPPSPIPADPVETKPVPAWKVPITKDQASPDQIQSGVKQVPLLKELKSFGMINTLNDETAIIPEHPIPLDTALIDGFLMRKIIEPMIAKHGLAYMIQRSSNGLLEAVLIRGKLPDQQLRELVSGARWAFERALEEKKP